MVGDGYNRDMSQSAESVQSSRIWTLPNLISIGRLLLLLPLTVYFLLQQDYVSALICLVALGLTDWLDGFLARRLNLITQFGKNLDPLADRVAIVAVGVALVVDGLLPWPYVAVIAATDITLGILGLAWFGGPPDIPVSRLGKVRTAGILVSMPLLILAAATGNEWVGKVGLVLLAIATVGHVLAGFGYWQQMYSLHKARRQVA